MKDTATFWDKVAPKYAKDPINDMAAYEYTLGRTLSYLKAEDHVLEMGCGTGSTALLIAPHVRQITGTDVSPVMVEIATTKARDNGIVNAAFRVATARGSAKLDDRFDAVLGFNLFHLVPDAQEVFADVAKMLPRGGYFITKTGCLGDTSLGWKRLMFKTIIPIMQAVGKAPFLHYFTHRDLEDALSAAGFELIECGNFPAMSRYIVARRL